MINLTSRNIFTALEIIIYVCFIMLDLRHMDSSALKYAGIVLCFMWSLYRKDRWATSAFLFTLTADWFLLVKNDHYHTGILAFIIVQLLYMYILYLKGCRICLPVRAVIFGVLLIMVYLSGQLSFLSGMAVFYFSLLTGNLISSLTNKDLKLFSSGLFLFICCDICVGLFNILPEGRICELAGVLMWLFYLPSQVLIALAQDD